MVNVLTSQLDSGSKDGKIKSGGVCLCQFAFIKVNFLLMYVLHT